MKLRSILIGATALVAATSAHAERASDGQLNIIYWQAPSLLNPYLSGGTKELEAASLVIEPLARYNEVGQMVPFLVDEIPTVENGGVSEDLTTITWKISDGITWSDGTPLTAEDAIFTWQYCTHPEGGCAQATNFSDVESMEALDSQTLKITFSVPKPFPYGPFVGAQSPIIQKAQFENCVGTLAVTCSDENFAPIGTGPFVVTDFKANDVATFAANENYRDPNKPAFATVNFKGGGDAASAARSVLETGEFDYAWNLQVEPEILTAMEAAGRGEIISAFGTSVERLMVNFTNPDPALGDERATVAHPHPFLTDTAVTRAMSIAIDREILVIAGYGSAGQETCNVLPAPAAFASPNNEWCKNYDPDEANRILDEAGWEMQSDGVRAKDGVRLSVLYQTSTNSVRQGTQALIKQMWEAIGIETELRNIDASVFFGGDQSSPDTFQKFFADIEMYTNNFDGTDPEAYMGNWTCAEIPSPDNAWLGMNMPRFCSEEYDALAAELSGTAALEERARIAIAMNDMLMNAGAIIPLIHRGGVSARANSLEGVLMNEWDSELWNAADWTRSN
ncbi:peptide/nickel transport system substrate-binding protein [Rubricella aquisinus]|uniref:Peptide/nickel transport system substrate-binding protein n=1 Tax=Rubricella aquisinus TaxID=2028108 RepID=A0A840WHC9_9RHOB|nr:peptide ABC transporter substrate-binding protein [Rubricella aquisinus]MBB5514528.1 peptide/nickel transport system substrate-binding protein [Rubricella aquisinus]